MLPPPLCSFYGAITTAMVISIAMGDTHNCTIYGPDRVYSSTVSNQEDVDSMIGNCTTFDGPIEIAQNYTGSFVLHTVTSLNGAIYSEIGPNDTFLGAPSLTSIEAPDLISIQGIEILNSSAITNISFPNLSTINSSGLTVQGLSGLAVSFPQLLNVTGSLSLMGNILSMDFSQLQTVTNGVVVTSNLAFYDSADVYDTTVDRTPYPPIDINFPALTNVDEDSVILVGNISRLVMPLKTTGSSTLSGLKISSYGTALNVTLLSLVSTAFLTLSGTFGRISIPALDAVDIYNLNSVLPMEANLENLHKVNDIDIEGNITSISMPFLENVDSIRIDSSIPMDCSPANDAWSRASAYGSNQKFSYSCTSPHPRGWLPLGAKIGLGLGIPASVAFLYLMFRWWRCERRIVKSSTKPPPEYDLGIPPSYAASADNSTELTLAGGQPTRRASSDADRSANDSGRDDNQADATSTRGEEVHTNRP